MQTLQSQIRLCGKAQWVLAALSAVGIVGFYFGLYRPRTNRLHELTAAVLKQQQDLRSGQSRARALPEVAVEVRNLRAQLDQIRRPSKRNELPQFIKDLTQLGQQASLKKFNYKPGVPARSDLYAELPMRLSFEGDFVNVFNFMRSAEEMQRLTRVRNMNVRVKDGRLGQVGVQLSMNVYFATE